MPFDKQDLLKAPYWFGECHEMDVYTPVNCEAWEDEDQYMKVLVWKEGKKTTLVFDEYIEKTKKNFKAKDQEVVVDLMNPLEAGGDFKQQNIGCCS